MERARFRGVRKVDSPWTRDSNTHEPGGVLSQAGFPEQGPRRWDDQMFEMRLKHRISDSANAGRTPRSAANRTPRGR